MNLKDIFSVPLDIGIIIEDVHHKPNTKEVLDVLYKYRGTIVLTSINQKSIPKEIKSIVKIKRTGKVNHIQDSFTTLAPRSQEPYDMDRDVFTIVLDYLRESDREQLLELLKFNKPPDTQIISWLAENIHPNRILFIDSVVRRRWPAHYFYEMLAYSHSGKTFTRPRMPTRRAYSKIPSICRRVGLKSGDEQLLRQLIKDESFSNHIKTKLNNSEYRLLGLGEKKVRKPKKKALKQITLEKF